MAGIRRLREGQGREVRWRRDYGNGSRERTLLPEKELGTLQRRESKAKMDVG